MKKMYRRLLYVFLMIVVGITGIDSTKAYNKELNVSNEIVFDARLYSNAQNSVELKGSLKNDDMKVYQQYVKLSSEQFNLIKNKNEELNKLIDETKKAYNKYAAIAAKVPLLPIEYETYGTEVINRVIENSNSDNILTSVEYQDLLLTEYAKEYQNYLNEKGIFEALNTTNNAKIENLRNEFIALITSYDDTKWTESNLLDKLDGSNKYGVAYPKELNYMISWVKASFNGVDTYNFMLYCSEETVDKPKTPVPPKETPKTPENPKTGNVSYYAYIILVMLISGSSYIVVNKMKKFNN